MKQRNYNMDIFRAMSILLIVIYHIWVLSGSKAIEYRFIYDIVALGGEIGVTAFFALSGYGIYCSLSSQENTDGKIGFKKYINKRCKRILPQYYICILITLLLMDGAYYLTRGHLLDIVSHILLVHNFILTCHGSINGVLWTMGIIFQFYLVAIPLYRFLKKRGIIALLSSVLFTIIVKALIYSVLSRKGLTGYIFFVMGRQLFTALDNFIVGMYVAYVITEKGVNIKKIQGWIILVLSVVFLDIVCRLGWKYGIHTNNLSGYTWHSLVGITIGGIMCGISFVSFDFIKPIKSMLLWISKYEYGIYLWHLMLINNLLAKSEFIIMLKEKNIQIFYYVFVMGLCILVGYLMTIMTDSIYDKCRSISHRSQK